VEPLEKALTARLKSDAVKQEVDRHEDMLRACLRALDALNRCGRQRLRQAAEPARARRVGVSSRRRSDCLVLCCVCRACPPCMRRRRSATPKLRPPPLRPPRVCRRAEGCEPFQAMMRRTVLGNAVLKEKLAAIEKERAEAEGAQAAA
jgi:hypothetical protein